MTLKLIKTETEHARALARIESLMSAAPCTPPAEELELLVHLVEKYEDEHEPIPMPDPIDAIRFRMDQQGLAQRDLVPFLGSKSRVSEVLAGKRPLTLAMIRELHEGLGIPLEVLVQGERATTAGEKWEAYPIAEMARRRWFGSRVVTRRDLLTRADELLGPFIHPPGMPAFHLARLRQKPRRGSNLDNHALQAWLARVWNRGRTRKIEPFRPGVVDEGFIREIAHLSTLDNGPLVARDLLARAGIRLVVEPPLPRTHLDGVAIGGEDGIVVVGLTVRYDRLDNFWFTLCHELAHVALHLGRADVKSFLDDLETDDRSREEKNADRLARDAMIPSSKWSRFLRSAKFGTKDVRAFADLLRVHPAIVAGRLRHEQNDYTILSGLLGQGQVRRLFSDT